jgi:hypothetical protein
MKIRYKLIWILFLLSGTAFAQEKHVIYVPGIENNLENPKNNWYDKSQGKNGLRTPISLFQELGFKPHRTEFSTLQYTDYEDISNEIADNADPSKNRKWIIIGHSLGGLRARIAHDEMYAKLGSAKFKGIVTLGTPHQGAPAAREEHKDYAVSVISNWAKDAGGAADWEQNNTSRFYGFSFLIDPILALVHTITTLVDWIVTLVVDLETDDHMENKLYMQITAAVMDKTKYNAHVIAPEGALIQKVNSIKTKVPHVSINGVESSKMMVRIEAAYADENKKIKDFDDKKDSARTMRGYHSWMKYINFFSYSHHKRGQGKWDRSIRAMNNIDNMWNKVIGENIKIAKSYRFQEWQSCDGRARYCYDCNGPAQVKQLESLFAMEGCSDPKKLDQGGVWVWKTRRYYVWVADKSDAFIPQKRTKWSPGQSIVKANPDGSIPDGAINVTYDGSEDPYKDGGYNHLEIINLYRTYGDKKESWPMWGAAWWMEKKFRE